MSTDQHNQGQEPATPPGSPAPAEVRRTGMRPWLKALLAVSLAANLAVVGLALGASLRWRDGAYHDRRPPSVGTMIFRDLDRDTRHDLRSRAKGEHGSYNARRRAEGEAVIAILMADPFDAGALADLLRQQAEIRHAFHLSVQQAWIAKIAAMPTDERKSYAQRLNSILRHRGDWDQGKPRSD